MTEINNTEIQKWMCQYDEFLYKMYIVNSGRLRD